MKKKLVSMVLVAIVAIVAIPRLAHAQDGCGALGFLIGCDIKLREEKQKAQYNLDQQELVNEAAAIQASLDAQKAAAQAKLEAEQAAIKVQYDKAVLDAQTEQQRIEAQMQRDSQMANLNEKRLEVDKHITELELQTRERMNALNSSAMLNTVALQSDMVKDVAATEVNIARENRIAAISVFAVVLVAGAFLAFAAYQYRRGSEVKAGKLMVLGPGERELAYRLTMKGVPWDVDQQGELVARHQGEWVVVSRNQRGY